MAYSSQREVSDGTLALLTISIEYFDRDEISVYFDGIVDALPWAWVGDTEKKISFAPAVPDTVEVLVLRSTDLSEIRHSLELGAAFTDETIDENMKQVLHIAQEARENSAIEDVYTDLNMHGYKVRNVGLAVNPGDAVSFQQFSTHDAIILGYKDAAATSASEAAASAVEAAASAATAESAADVAVSTHVAEPDPHTQYALTSELTTVAKTDATQTYTSPQKTTVTTDNDLNFDLSTVLDAVCTPSAGGTMSFTNIAAGVGFEILLINNMNYTIIKGSNIKCPSALFTTLSLTGRYRLTGKCFDGTNVDLDISAAHV